MIEVTTIENVLIRTFDNWTDAVNYATGLGIDCKVYDPETGVTLNRWAD